LNGAVRTAGGSFPIVGASVRFTPNGGTNSFSATTDSSGLYQLVNLPAGLYAITITAAGYTTFTSTLTLPFSAQFIALMNPLPAATFTLNGTVTDGTSHGILPGITVQVASGTNAGKSAVTDSSGNYSMIGLAAGTFTLSASATSYQTATQQVTLSANTRVDLVLQRVAPTPTPTPAPTATVSPVSCWAPGGVSLIVPTNSPVFIPSASNCSTTVVLQFFWQLPGGGAGAAYATLGPGHGSFLPTEIGGTATTKPVAIFYGWFGCPQGYGPVLPGTTTSVSYSTGSNYQCLAGVGPSGYQLGTF